MSRCCLVALALLGVVLAACGEPIATPEPIFLQASGSMAVAPLVDELASAYSEGAPTVKLEVSSLGTRYGLDALRAGEADLALASWLAPTPPGEDTSGFGLEPEWTATVIARDGIAVIVHPDNPVDGLGLLQLRDLFSGRTFDWQTLPQARSLGPVQPVSREQGSGARAAFESQVMEGLSVTPRSVVAPSSSAVVEYVANHPQAIGYVSMALVPSAEGALAVKVLEIEGILPTQESTGQGVYPLSRELWVVTGTPPPPEVQDWIEFALSPAGQQIVGARYGRIR